MTYSMYQASVPALLQILNSLIEILDKAAAHCEAKKVAPEVLMQSRLYPDMLPFYRQIHIATDQAKGAVARLAGAEVPSWTDSETTIDELKERLNKTIAFVKSFKPEQFAGVEDRTLTMKIGGNEMSLPAPTYLANFVQPNFYFHATTAYAILRHCGVELGKRDFLGKA